MKTTPIFYKNYIAATALFVLGNGVIFLPAYSGENLILSYLLAFASGLIICYLSTFLAKFSYSENKSFKAFKIIIFIFLCVFSIYTAAQCFIDFTDFVSEIMLPSFSKAIINLSFVLIVVFYQFKRQENILKFSLLAFVGATVLILLFLLVLGEEFETKNISFSFNFKDIFLQSKDYFLSVFLPILILPFYQKKVFKKSDFKTNFIGLLIGSALLLCCVLTSALLFGGPLTTRLFYPYASAVSTVSVGKLFTRMDGFSYILYFVSAITKINLCIFVCFSALKEINRLTKK